MGFTDKFTTSALVAETDTYGVQSTEADKIEISNDAFSLGVIIEDLINEMRKNN